ncbi:hypothetical protein JOC78_000469 [Bacillus ectoiniformans]|uniref:DUF3899 domain-containing protein n=1 Tax=Bacillus ectoiniformans TaxID=1494429 RepID=UPI00195CB6C0|nr:DUF3899 domain-containing protein [Bacillus ectoiniformans]MBM7647548.1 hypothetical protein [Bacillus ectoiniformans]
MKPLLLGLMIIGLILVTSLAGSLFLDPFLLSFLNISFFISLFVTMLGASLFVVEKGFFNGITYSFKRLRRSSSEGKYISQFDSLDDTEDIHIEHPKQRIYKWTYPLLAGGGFIAVLDILIAYFSVS